MEGSRSKAANTTKAQESGPPPGYEDSPAYIPPVMREHVEEYVNSCLQIVQQFLRSDNPPPVSIKHTYPGWPTVHVTVGLDHIRGCPPFACDTSWGDVDASLKALGEATDDEDEKTKKMRRLLEKLLMLAPMMTCIQYTRDGEPDLSVERD